MMEAGTTPGTYDVGSYLALAECGILAPDDRVELLDGMLVSMAPASPLHCSVLFHVQEVLRGRLPTGTIVRTQMPFLAGKKSMPEPDLAVVPGRNADYLRRHPTKVHLIIEISDSSLPQDGLTKAAIYAKAAVPTYWIVNLRNESVECHTEPDQVGRRYQQLTRVTGSQRLPLPVFPEVNTNAGDLFPMEMED